MNNMVRMQSGDEAGISGSSDANCTERKNIKFLTITAYMIIPYLVEKF